MKKTVLTLLLILFVTSSSALWVWSADRDSPMWQTASGDTGTEKCNWIIDNYNEDKATDYCTQASNLATMDLDRNVIADLIFAAREGNSFTEEERVAIADMIFCWDEGISDIDACTGMSYWHDSSSDVFPQLISVAIENDIGNMRSRVQEVISQAAENDNTDDFTDLEDKLQQLEPGYPTDDGTSEDSDSGSSVNWNGWELKKSTLEGKSDELSIDTSGGAILDSGSDGYCGEAYFEKNFTVSDDSADKLQFNYDVDGDKWAGEAFVSVNGDVIKSANPSGEEVQESGTWNVYLGPGDSRVRFGIRDTSSEHCSAGDHSLKLEISGVTRTDTNFAVMN